MTAFEVATEFFHACESLKGWQGCEQYVSSGAAFEAQSEPLTDVATVEGYCEWMAGLGQGPLKGCSYTLHASSWDEANSTALFFATFHGTHSEEGGPVPATGKTTASHYVYVIQMDEQARVAKLTKVWNAPWALRELGWM
jgi:hypothetical protein